MPLHQLRLYIIICNYIYMRSYKLLLAAAHNFVRTGDVLDVHMFFKMNTGMLLHSGVRSVNYVCAVDSDWTFMLPFFHSAGATSVQKCVHRAFLWPAHCIVAVQFYSMHTRLVCQLGYTRILTLYESVIKLAQQVKKYEPYKLLY